MGVCGTFHGSELYGECNLTERIDALPPRPVSSRVGQSWMIHVSTLTRWRRESIRWAEIFLWEIEMVLSWLKIMLMALRA